jgi:hypothetical protein
LQQREDDEGLTASGSLLGTVDYMAPGQLAGDPVDGRADIYALACCLYQCLTGAMPFGGNEIAVLLGHMQASVPLLPAELRLGRLDPVIQRARAKDPDDRHQSADEFAAALAAAVTAESAAPRAQWAHASRARRSIVAGALIVVCLLIAVVVAAEHLRQASAPANTPGTARNPPPVAAAISGLVVSASTHMDGSSRRTLMRVAAGQRRAVALPDAATPLWR